MIFPREQRVSLIELANIVGAIIRRQRDAGERDFDARPLQRRNYLFEIGASVLDRQTAQPIVAAKLDYNDGRMERENVRQPRNPVLRSVATDSLIGDAVVVMQPIQIGLKVVGEALPRLGAKASGQAIAETNQHRASVITVIGASNRRRNCRVPGVRVRLCGSIRPGRPRTCFRSCIRRFVRAASRSGQHQTR